MRASFNSFFSRCILPIQQRLSATAISLSPNADFRIDRLFFYGREKNKKGGRYSANNVANIAIHMLTKHFIATTWFDWAAYIMLQVEDCHEIKMKIN